MKKTKENKTKLISGGYYWIRLEKDKDKPYKWFIGQYAPESIRVWDRMGDDWGYFLEEIAVGIQILRP